MKFEQKIDTPTKQRNSIVRFFAFLAVALIATIQLGCSSSGSAPQQVFGQPGNFGTQGAFQAGSGTSFQNPAQFNSGGSGTSFQNPVQFNSGGSGTNFQTNPNGQFFQGGSGTSFQNPAQFNSGGFGTNFQSNPSSGSRGIFGVGYQQYQAGFNPFAPRTTC